MPRIKGVGELDWKFIGTGNNPIFIPHTFASERVLCFRLCINRRDPIGFKTVVCCDGQFTERGTPFPYQSVSRLEDVIVLPELVYAAQQLSLIYKHGVMLLILERRLYGLELQIAVHHTEAAIDWPSRYVASIAQKISRYVKEYRQLQEKK